MAYDQQLVQRVRSLLEGVPGLVEKKMFGGIGYIVNGNMACGVNGEQLIVRMSPADYAEALTQPHVREFDLTGRSMKGWIFIQPAGVENDQDLKAWVERGLHYAQGMPPK